MYDIYGGIMKIYIDYVLLINFFFDFLILLTVSIILKRNRKLYRIILGSLIGSLSVLILFLNISNISLFLFKLLISIMMIITAFGCKDFMKNFLYLYFVSIILGGFLYFINNTFSYKVEGLLFINNGFSINLILLFLISPIIIYIYIKENKLHKKINNLHIVTIKYLNKTYTYSAYLDTGNNLYDPYFHKPVCILYDSKIDIKNIIYIPYNTLSETGMLKGFKVEEMIIDNKDVYKNVLIGISDNKFNLFSCDMILHSSYL